MNGRRADIQLQEKGGVVNRVPLHHKIREYLDGYIEAAKLAQSPESWLWRSMPGRKDDLSEKPMSRHDALQVVKRRCATANLPADVCCHSFRGSGITLYRHKGGNLEHAQKIAGHADPRTTRLYDRTGDTVSLDEVERIVFRRARPRRLPTWLRSGNLSVPRVKIRSWGANGTMAPSACGTQFFWARRRL